MSGRILGVTPETVCASPQRKSRGNSKRSAGVEVQRSILRPSAPAFKPASSIPAAPAPPLAPGAIEAAKKAAKNQRSRSASKTSSRTYSAAAAASTAESGSTATDPPADAAASSLRSRGVRVDESRNEWKRFEENSVDDDDEWEENHIEVCLEAASNGSCQWVASGIVRVTQNRKNENLPTSKPKASEFFTTNPGIQGSNLFVRVSALLGKSVSLACQSSLFSNMI